MVTTIQLEPTAAWTRLELSAEWSALTGQQKTWVAQFLATWSALDATRTAYKPKSDANARVMSYEIAANHRIKAALAVANGDPVIVRTERDGLVRMVKKQLAAAKPGSEAAQKFTEQLERLILNVEPEKDSQHKRGNQNGIPRRDRSSQQSVSRALRAQE